MHHDLISCTVALNGIYNSMKQLTSSSARLRGNPIIYTRFRWITLTSLRCFLPSEGFGFDFCSFCFRSKFLSATNLFSSECHDVTQQLIKLYKTKWAQNRTSTLTTFHNLLPSPQSFLCHKVHDMLDNDHQFHLFQPFPLCDANTKRTSLKIKKEREKKAREWVRE